MSVLLAILLGLVQGVTEFLPVSSSGHLSLLQTLFHVEYSEEQHLLFNVLLLLGTLVAICFAYREDLKKMSKGGVRLLRGQMDFSIFGDPLIPATRQLLCLLVGLLPLIPVLLLNRYISALFSMPGFIGFAFIANGFLLFVCDRLIRAGNKTARTITPADGFWIGLAQACAVLPGLSLMGATLTTALSRGCSRSYAMRFSLLLSIPAVAGGLPEGGDPDPAGQRQEQVARPAHAGEGRKRRRGPHSCPEHPGRRADGEEEESEMGEAADARCGTSARDRRLRPCGGGYRPQQDPGGLRGND